jgi:hypothetical protein
MPWAELCSVQPRIMSFALKGFLKYAINIEKASVIYLSPVQKERVKRKWLDLEAVLSG